MVPLQTKSIGCNLYVYTSYAMLHLSYMEIVLFAPTCLLVHCTQLICYIVPTMVAQSLQVTADMTKSVRFLFLH